MDTTLLTDEQIEPKLLALIREARDWVWLVSPYLALWGHLKDTIRLAVNKGVRVIVIVRADERLLSSEDVRWLTQNSVTVAVSENLHAKIYMSEQIALVSSMNLTQYSTDNSHEIALVVEDKQAARQIQRYVTDSLLVSASLIEASDANAITRSEDTQVGAGFCIRCGQRIAFDQSRPLCEEDHQVWATYRNDSYPENFCHRCGRPKAVTYARPLCQRC
ncbi:MAG: hypothetical protein HY672_02775 [Chloroflexi bacterium]|nr:hypothetical protein [Chloroflexota bacterium]